MGSIDTQVCDVKWHASHHTLCIHLAELDLIPQEWFIPTTEQLTLANEAIDGTSKHKLVGNYWSNNIKKADNKNNTNFIEIGIFSPAEKSAYKVKIDKDIHKSGTFYNIRPFRYIRF